MCTNGNGRMAAPNEEAGRSVPPLRLRLPPKMIGRNANGTIMVTATPVNDAELQLYRVMQRASLLAYYDTMLAMGGDDLRQLCDAGEEEFLEIMSLVGMASKPLHVRRLQKVLHEWLTDPDQFKYPVLSTLVEGEPSFFDGNEEILNMAAVMPNLLPITVSSPEAARAVYTPSPGAPETLNQNSCPPSSSPVPSQAIFSKIMLPSSPASTATTSATPSRSFSPQNACPPSAGSSPSSVTSPVLPPVLLDVHVQKLASAAESLYKILPPLEPKPPNTKKKLCRDLELVMMMSESDPKRMEEIRKYAAIYGRFDCKRKPEKPLTLHEVTVNEAAAQMCRFMPALLTRRDELFKLARELVRNSGLHFSRHSYSLATSSGEDRDRDDGEPSRKRPRQEEEAGNGVRTSPEARHYSWWALRPESEDTDSRCSYSSTSTPPLDIDEGRPQVVAARGDSIIAVANPALQLPPAMLPPSLQLPPAMLPPALQLPPAMLPPAMLPPPPVAD